MQFVLRFFFSPVKYMWLFCIDRVGKTTKLAEVALPFEEKKNAHLLHGLINHPHPIANSFTAHHPTLNIMRSFARQISPPLPPLLPQTVDSNRASSTPRQKITDKTFPQGWPFTVAQVAKSCMVWQQQDSNMLAYKVKNSGPRYESPSSTEHISNRDNSKK